ncbi:porin family protein [Alteromonas halophila]|uniref:Membrane protein n=1 Tax=Alteromonas halophila TaxID=516698 RepID=A0A918MY25_9ALTE|nr:porin family protein [Alteromonas halophila]GGW86583.1 membrane protein [Alteromonas halophila]
MKHIKSTIAGIVALTAFGAQAQSYNQDENIDDAGFYVGGNYGYLRVDGDDEFDDDKDVWQGVAGYRFNEYFALEGSYIDFGDYGNDLANAETDGFTAGLKGTYPITERFSIFGKLGQLWSETEYNVGTVNNDYDDESVFVGGGVSYAVNERFLITAEYTVYDSSMDAEDAVEDIDDTEFNTDLKQASLGVEYRF